MDVVNGKIVSARTERSRSDIWRALKPSRGLLQEAGPSSQAGKPAGSLRGYGLPVAPGAAAFDQPGWKWSWSTDQRPNWGRDIHRKCRSPSSEFVSRAFLDKELDMCESLVSRAVIDGRFASTKSVGEVTSTTSVTPAVMADSQLRPGAPAANPLKRPHSQIDQGEGATKVDWGMRRLETEKESKATDGMRFGDDLRCTTAVPPRSSSGFVRRADDGAAFG